MKMTRAVTGLMMLGLVLMLAACPEQITVQRILDDPARYFNKEVAIRGRVTNAIGAFKQGIYQVDDGTGKIWVVVENSGVPRKDADVELMGTVIPGATFGEKSYGTAIREKKHRVKY